MLGCDAAGKSVKRYMTKILYISNDLAQFFFVQQSHVLVSFTGFGMLH